MSESDWLTEWLARQAATGRFGTREAEPWFAEQVTGKPAPDGGYLVPPGLADELAEVVKFSAVMLVPDELLAERPVPAWKPPLRWRIKTFIWDARHKAAWLAYRLIAGTTPEADYGGDE